LSKQSGGPIYLCIVLADGTVSIAAKKLLLDGTDKLSLIDQSFSANHAQIIYLKTDRF
jgi:hypothetical protein